MRPSEWHQVLEKSKQYGGMLSEVMVNIISADTDEVIMYTLPEESYRKPGKILELVLLFQEQLSTSNTTMTVGTITFDKGQELLDWIHKEKLNLEKDKEVHQ